ncbi:MAG TPA: glycosyltransferase [Treponemataceae bacterium]|nr:glycosyltransferase [Synergistales bacterium]HNQ96772.1 glycosyltransferase [Treponemataceae bacterium]HQL01788.1 glycosyltransferase [Synergistales bacterium]
MTDLDPLVSVVVPVFNMESVIGTTLNDIIQQKDIIPEVIVVNDASTDGSLGIISEALRKYRGPHKIISIDKNLGASYARNIGLDASVGKYVFFIDGDDRMAEETLVKMLNLAETHQADIVFSGFRVCGPGLQDGKVYSWKGSKEGFCNPREVLRSFLRGKRFLNASNTLYSKEFLEYHGIRFPRGCRFAEDREFIVKALFHAKRAAFTAEPLVSYIQHPGQTTNKPGTGINKYAHSVGVCLRLKKYFENRESGESILNLLNTYELPDALLKMLTETAKANDLAKFQKVINSQFIRSALRPGFRSILFKPEVAYKAWEALNLPRALFRSYKKKGRGH